MSGIANFIKRSAAAVGGLASAVVGFGAEVAFAGPLLFGAGIALAVSVAMSDAKPIVAYGGVLLSPGILAMNLFHFAKTGEWKKSEKYEEIKEAQVEDKKAADSEVTAKSSSNEILNEFDKAKAKQIEDLRAQGAKVLEGIKANFIEADKLESSIHVSDNKKNLVRVKTGQLNDLKAAHARLNAEYENHKKKVAKMDGVIKTCENKIEALMVKVKACNDKLAALGSDEKGAKQRVALTGEGDKYIKEIEKLKGRIGKIEGAKDAYEKKEMADVVVRMGRLDSVNDVENEIKILMRDIIAGEKVSSMRSESGKYREEIEKLNGQLKDVNNNLKKLGANSVIANDEYQLKNIGLKVYESIHADKNKQPSESANSVVEPAVSKPRVQEVSKNVVDAPVVKVNAFVEINLTQGLNNKADIKWNEYCSSHKLQVSQSGKTAGSIVYSSKENDFSVEVAAKSVVSILPKESESQNHREVAAKTMVDIYLKSVEGKSVHSHKISSQEDQESAKLIVQTLAQVLFERGLTAEKINGKTVAEIHLENAKNVENVNAVKIEVEARSGVVQESASAPVSAEGGVASVEKSGAAIPESASADQLSADAGDNNNQEVSDPEEYQSRRHGM